jgi:hypothetical protein
MAAVAFGEGRLPRGSWLEATPTKAILHCRQDGAARHNPLLRKQLLHYFALPQESGGVRTRPGLEVVL